MRLRITQYLPRLDCYQGIDEEGRTRHVNIGLELDELLGRGHDPHTVIGGEIELDPVTFMLRPKDGIKVLDKEEVQ